MVLKKVKHLRQVLLAITVLGLCACGSKPQETAEEEMVDEATGEWPAMDHFHMIMAESFHPFKDSANLEPAKQNASAMADAAAQWLGGSLPSPVDSDDTRAKLRDLADATQAFVNTVASGDDPAIAEALTSIHDIFHELQETWYTHHTSGHEAH